MAAEKGISKAEAINGVTQYLPLKRPGIHEERSPNVSTIKYNWIPFSEGMATSCVPDASLFLIPLSSF